MSCLHCRFLQTVSLLILDLRSNHAGFSDVGLETWSRSRDLSRPVFDGLGFALEYAGLGLGLGLSPSGLGLGLGLGLGSSGLGLAHLAWSRPTRS